MKLWIDGVRPAPKGYYWCKNVNQAKIVIELYSSWLNFDNEVVDLIELIDIDCYAGDYGSPDYIKFLDWLEETGRNYPIYIHSMDSIGIET